MMFQEITRTWVNLGTDQIYVQNVGMFGDLIEIICATSQPANDARGNTLDQIKETYRVTPRSGEFIYARYRRADDGPTNQKYAQTGRIYYTIPTLDQVSPVGGWPASIFDGNKALTVQSFSELNSKRGNQFEVSFANPSFPANSSAYYIVITGSQPVIIKNQIFQFTFATASTQVFKNPTYTGGNLLPIYNFNDITPATPEVQFLIGGVVVTNEGTPIAPVVTTYGTAGGGNNRVPSVGASTGAERVLAPNTTYAFKATNATNQDGATSGLINFYEGPLSINNPI